MRDEARQQHFAASLAHTQETYAVGVGNMEKCGASRLYTKEVNALIKETMKRTVIGIRGGGGREGGRGGGGGKEEEE